VVASGSGQSKKGVRLVENASQERPSASLAGDNRGNEWFCSKRAWSKEVVRGQSKKGVVLLEKGVVVLQNGVV